jgi:hypothetical protein
LRPSGVNALLVEAMSADTFLTTTSGRLITKPVITFARPRQG